MASTHLRLVAPGLYGKLLPKGGFLGVDAFFVLSGFLITVLLLQEYGATGRIRLGGFYLRRALRLLPALLLLLCAHVVYASATDVPFVIERDSLLSVALYVSNWKIVLTDGWPLIAPGLAHLWSLSVEEQFYIVWPLAVIGVLAATGRKTVAIGAVSIAICATALWRAVLVNAHPPGIVYFRTDARADALLAGALLAFLWRDGRLTRHNTVRRAAWGALVFFAVCACFVESTNLFYFRGGFTLVAISVAIMVLATLETDWIAVRALTWRPLRAIGRVSYGLYLWHYFVFFALSEHAQEWSTLARVVVAISLTAAATCVSWFLVEQQFLHLKARLVQTPSAAEANGSPRPSGVDSVVRAEHALTRPVERGEH